MHEETQDHISMHGEKRDEEQVIEHVENFSNPRRSLECDMSVSRDNDVQQQQHNAHESSASPITPNPTTNILNMDMLPNVLPLTNVLDSVHILVSGFPELVS